MRTIKHILKLKNQEILKEKKYKSPITYKRIFNLIRNKSHSLAET